MVSELLHLVARANLAASVAIVLVALLRWPVRSTFGPSAAYVLWGIPLIMALASVVPTPRAGAIAPIVLPPASSIPAAALLANGSVWPIAIGAAWALGALISAAVLGAQQLRFALAMRGAAPASIGGTAVLRAPGPDVGPAVAGGRIVLPVDFEDRFTPAEQAAVLAHEAQHQARGDEAANAVVSLVQCLCWFNPLVHLAAHWLRIDQELACDAAVIAGRPGLRRPYAEALLKTQVIAVAPPAGCAWRARGFRALRDRIRLLKGKAPSRPRRICGLLLVAALTIGGGYTAWAAQPAQGRMVTHPDWSSLPGAADLARFYPRKASARGMQGMAMMRCRVERTGALSGCRVLRQTPPGFGFGEAMLRMAPLFRMRPMSVDGRPVAGGTVIIPVKFALRS